MTHEQIVAAICTRISSMLSGVTIRYPGDVLDVEQLSEWATVDVTHFKSDSRRKANKDQRHGEIDIGIWVKSGSNTYRILRLSSDFVTALRHAEIVVRNYDASGDPRTGAIRVNEPKRNWRTRKLADVAKTNARALVLTFPAYAQGD